MPAATDLVRFGTRIMPSKRDVLIRGPAAEVFEQSSLWSRSTVSCSKELVNKFPTFTVIDSCVSDKTALLAWQEDKISKIGIVEFMAYMRERAGMGRRFHKALEDLLELKKKNAFPPLEKVLSTTHDSIHGYLQSVYPFLQSLPVADCVLEGNVVHYDLFYTGRFDAVILLPNGPCLIDWKTTSERSAVSRNHEKGDGLRGLYGYPKQIAAYVGAFHNDPTYNSYNLIKSGSIVMAHDSGAEAVVHDIGAEDLEQLFQDFVQDLRIKFWKRIEEGKRNFVCRTTSRS